MEQLSPLVVVEIVHRDLAHRFPEVHLRSIGLVDSIHSIKLGARELAYLVNSVHFLVLSFEFGGALGAPQLPLIA